MKTKLTIALVAVLLGVTFATTHARQLAEPAVKVLPTTREGIIKIHYAYETAQPVEVKFYNDEGVLTSDKIKGESYPHGFSKKYDISHLTSKNLWVEVTSAYVSVTYKLIESKDHKTFEPLLEKTVYTHPLVASNH